VLLAAAGLLAYANSFDGVFLLDDHLNIKDNESLRSFGNVLRAPRPLVVLTLTINYALGGDHVAGYHAVNLVIHLLAGLTLYALLRRTFRRLPADHAAHRAATGLAFAVALLWIVHPLQTQAVTYIIQRHEALMGLFYLLTLFCIVAGDDSPSRRSLWYVAAALCCALGMLSKEVMVTAPVLALVYDRIFLAPSWREVMRRRWPLYLGLAATWLLLAKPLRWVFETTNPDSSAGFGLRSVTSWEYLRSQPGVLLHYLRLVFYPQPLCLDYQWPVAHMPLAIVGPGLVIVALLLLTAWALWRRPWLGFWGAWFFLILAPTSSIMPIADLAFEHRMYLPLAGVLVLAALAAHHGLCALALGAGWHEATLHWRQAVAVSLVAVVCIVLTFARNEDYGSELDMCKDVLKQFPDNVRARYNLARALLAVDKVEEADAAFREALRIRPADAQVNLGYGQALCDQGRFDDAERYLREALRINPRLLAAKDCLDEIRDRKKGR
jgi:tetratricopeptide (TPR) repeat protein